jgi:anti-sigma regulatory factor (Ser/Thr protein kinase)
VLAISLRPSGRKWGTVSFASTLHLCPVLDLLLADVPARCREDVRLGLQEALVNAAKHGNKLDPNKTVVVEFFAIEDQYWWIIADQGKGLSRPAAALLSLYSPAMMMWMNAVAVSTFSTKSLIR